MLFNSQPFAVLVVVTFGLYYLPFLQRFQSQILILSSFVFYAWESPVFLFLLLVSIFVNSVISFLVAYPRGSRVGNLFIAGIAFNLLILSFFKYGSLAAETLELDKIGVGRVLISIPLPIGISFYTFESISLLVDLWRGKAASRRPFIPRSPWLHAQHTALFFAFFPHLVSGPILKADEFYPQIGPKLLEDVPWNRVFRFCVLGFFLKMVVADNLKEYTNQMAYPQFMAFSSLTLVALLFGFSMQIFSDFSGYSSIALGLGLLFGYKLPTNFNFPYLAVSLADFWRRWHMSLSLWLREYLYFSLGGNKRGRPRMYLNLFLVMALGGLWHGAAWSFALWGLYHGLGLALERWIEDRTGGVLSRLPAGLRIVGVFCFVTLGWLTFKLTRFPEVALYLRAMVQHVGGGYDTPVTLLFALGVFSIPVVAYHLLQLLPRAHALFKRSDVIAYGAMLAGIVVSYGPPGSFLYFQF